MKMENMAALAPSTAPESGAVSADVFQQLGTLTRLLHDTMHQLGVMPQLKVASEGLPDARSRLNFIAKKTAEAADKVLTSVEQAQGRPRPHHRSHARAGQGPDQRPSACGGHGLGAELCGRHRGQHGAH
jgi:chemotaxis regulatin CheY-phosphate phosphatase CheZ